MAEAKKGRGRPKARPAEQESFRVDLDDVFCKKRKSGRPRKYTDARQLEKDMQKYFNACWRPKINMYGQIIRDENGKMVFEQFRPYTVAGLALALGMSRETLLRYGEDEVFADVVSRAKDKVHAYTEEQLIAGRNPSGAAFSLKNNFGWKDEQQVSQHATLSIPPEDAALMRKMEELLTDNPTAPA